VSTQDVIDRLLRSFTGISEGEYAAADSEIWVNPADRDEVDPQHEATTLFGHRMFASIGVPPGSVVLFDRSRNRYVGLERRGL